MWKGQSFQKMVLEKLDNTCKRIPHTKLTWDGLKINIRIKILKLLEENIWEKLLDMEFGNDLLDMMLKAQKAK